ncbi:MAG: KH domain-containing protein [Clostridia bacterium]|nr:KH domain-containing protein [Clostridia bacterium]
MDELVLFMAKSLVSLPEEVSVNTKQDGDCTVIELHVAEQDMGKVIGRQGRIAKAIRTIVRAASLKENRKYMVEII